jgi:uncharacterized protein (DUF1330 family)
MPAYCIVDVIEEFDAERMADYRSRVSPVVERHGGTYLVINGRTEVMEGDWRPTHPVFIEFPTMEQARGWYDSDDYRELRELRKEASRGTVVFIDGL